MRLAWSADPYFFDIGTSWRWVVSFMPCRVIPGKDTHWIGGWVDPRTGLSNMEKWYSWLPGFELWPLVRSVRSQPLCRLCYRSSREGTEIYSSSRIMALGLTQPPIGTSTRKLPWSKTRPARKADDLTDICERIAFKMWDPRHLTTL
jgi:hypothetical protein